MTAKAAKWYIALAAPPMEEIKRLSSPIRFGIFEVDLPAGELRRQGFKVKLQEQPFQVLTMLLECPGEVVTREKLQNRLWPTDTFVDFDRGLNRAINKLREALVDDADNPRFIETLPRRGYRFLASVEMAGTQELETASSKRLAIVSTERLHKVEDPVSTVVPRRLVGRWAVAGILIVFAVIAYSRPWRPPAILANRPFLQLDLDSGSDEFSEPAISSDGVRIVFVANGALAIRRLDQAKVNRLAGTEGASYPFFSPNGQWVAFFAARKLQKVPVEGGALIPLCDAPNAGGGTWGADDIIIAALDLGRGLSQVPAVGGMPQSLTNSRADPSGTLMHLWPQALPGGKGVLFSAVNGSSQGSLRVAPNHGTMKTLVENSTHGRYLDSGYLVYNQQQTLFAAPMDADRLELTGPAVPLVYGVSNSALGRMDFDLSASGTLVYRRGATRNSVPSWVYSSGKIEPVLSKPGSYATPRLSPDGARLALSINQEGKQNIWVYDLSRETLTRLTFGAVPDSFPTWTPDGKFVVFRSGNTLAWTRSDGSGNVDSMSGVSRDAGPWSFSADGNWLAFWPLQPGSDLWTAPVVRSGGVLRLGSPQPLLKGEGSKGAPAISPDGRWLAYTSDESGRFEVYVTPFLPLASAGSRKWQVSNEGGWSPIWSRNGRELFYQRFDTRIQLAAYTVKGDAFVTGKPRFWSQKRLADIGLFPGYDVAPDGARVLALLPAEDSKPETLFRLLLNVDSELRRRATAGNK